jgi:hypothetical protein
VHEEMVWLPTSRRREGDELNYSITSSTHSTSPAGTAWPIAFAAACACQQA